MMILIKAFWNSLLLPRKEAMFQLNRMKMGNTLVYLFILLFLITVPSGVTFALSDHKDIGQHIPPTLFVLQFLVFDYFLFVFVGLCAISLIAVICMGISEALRRKLAYRYLWKITVYATTIPFLLYGIATALNDHASLLLIGLFILSLAILIRIIVIFPRRNH